ncbi:hypothetical protein ACFWWC_12330 [Streptomyces sp. NPDC058642]|uniref:hypothetical protein n=1 Tax=Streptomyces sp. NPDC058642 TaxID=3346572 RepID=UPI00364F92F0
MTHRRIHPRLPEGTERIADIALEPRPDGSLILTLTVVAKPLELTARRFFFDPYATWSLIHALAADLDGVQDPGPTPEVAAFFAAVDSGDQAAIKAACDGVNDRVLALWTDGSAAA